MGDAKFICRNCHVETSHDDLFETESDDGGSETASVHKCNGCGALTFRHRFAQGPNKDLATTLYPPRIFRRLPDWIEELPSEIPAYLEEIYISLQVDSRRLAAMGIRAALEQLMVKRHGDKGSFEKNLSELEKQGDISVAQKDTLAVVLDLGSAAIHRGYHPEYEDVVGALGIFEVLLEQLFVHAERMKTLKSRIPARPSSKDKD